MNIHDEIAQIEKETAERIQKLKEKAASSIAQKLTEAKDKLKEAQKEVDDLAKEYALATGKTIKGEKVKGPRTSITKEQKEQLQADILKAVEKSPNGISMGDIKEKFNMFTSSAVQTAKVALTDKKAIKMVGDKRSAVYVVSGKK